MPRVGELFNPRNIFTGLWVPDALARCRDISHGAKMTYARLCWHIDPRTLECSPDIETLADGIGISKRQVLIYLKELHTTGFIVTKRRGLGKTNTYAFPWHPVFDSNPLRRSAKDGTSENAAEVQSSALLKTLRIAPPKALQAAFPIEDLEEMPLEVKNKSACSWCHGRGELGTGSSRSQCGVCRGSGRAGKAAKQK